MHYLRVSCCRQNLNFYDCNTTDHKVQIKYPHGDGTYEARPPQLDPNYAGGPDYGDGEINLICHTTTTVYSTGNSRCITVLAVDVETHTISVIKAFVGRLTLGSRSTVAWSTLVEVAD